MDSTRRGDDGVSRSVSDWVPESLLGEGGRAADLFGDMLRVPQLKPDLVEVGGSGYDKSRISEITNDRVKREGSGRYREGVLQPRERRRGGHRRAHRCMQGDLSHHRQQRHMGRLGAEPGVGDRLRQALGSRQAPNQYAAGHDRPRRKQRGRGAHADERGAAKRGRGAG